MRGIFEQVVGGAAASELHRSFGLQGLEGEGKPCSILDNGNPYATLALVYPKQTCSPLKHRALASEGCRDTEAWSKGKSREREEGRERHEVRWA